MSTLNCHQLLKIASNVAKGMIHLASQKVRCSLHIQKRIQPVLISNVNEMLTKIDGPL